MSILEILIANLNRYLKNDAGVSPVEILKRQMESEKKFTSLKNVFNEAKRDRERLRDDNK